MAIKANNAGRGILYMRDLGNDQKLFTFVIWADEERGNRPE
jgi:hypothetical protein